MQGNAVKLMEYEDYAQHGRDNFQRWARESGAKAAHYTALAARHPPGSRSWRRNTRTAERFKRRVVDFESRAADTQRYLWRITIAGYGEFHWVGTPAAAEGRRATKARWEGGVGRAEKVRPALPGESDGEWRPPGRQAA